MAQAADAGGAKVYSSVVCLFICLFVIVLLMIYANTTSYLHPSFVQASIPGVAAVQLSRPQHVRTVCRSCFLVGHLCSQVDSMGHKHI